MDGVAGQERRIAGERSSVRPSMGFGQSKLSLLSIVQMNIGFFGLQFSFGLQQSNMGPIYSYLGASEAAMPLLWLAGPMTGLIVQPLVGALSDRTISRLGRRTPYFLVGAVICSLGLLAMPYSRTLWIAATLLWILDAANNITMEPYRAYVGDRLNASQRPIGFLTQSAFTGLAQTLAYLAPSILVFWGMDANAVDANHVPNITRAAFLIGAVLSLTTILWSALSVRELPPSQEQIAKMRRTPLSLRGTIDDICSAFIEMPPTMRQLALAMLCQWYAMFCYWQFITFAVARTLHNTADPSSPGFRDAALATGQLGGFYNFVAFGAAFIMVPITRRCGARAVHAFCMVAAGAAMLIIPGIETKALLFVPMIGIGIGWASLMGNPYVMLVDSIPPERTGVYMGIFNMFIVVPMLIESLTMPLLYNRILGGDPRHVLCLSGMLMLAAAAATMRISGQPRGAKLP